MSVLGVITCQILELEFVHLLSRDAGLSMITVVEDEFSQELVKRLRTAKPGVRTIPHLNGFAASRSDQPELLLCVKEVGLHSVIKRLQDAVVTAVSAMGPYVDAILLGYGLCGNALNHADALFSTVRVPVFLPMDEDHPVDDCVGLIIGGREAYYEEQCKCAGTMFMNAGFSRHWEKILRKGDNERFDPKIAERLMANYKRSLLLPTEVMAETEMVSRVEDFNECYGLRMERRPGTLRILEQAWEDARAFVAGACRTCPGPREDGA